MYTYNAFSVAAVYPRLTHPRKSLGGGEREAITSHFSSFFCDTLHFMLQSLCSAQKEKRKKKIVVGNREEGEGILCVEDTQDPHGIGGKQKRKTKKKGAEMDIDSRAYTSLKKIFSKKKDGNFFFQQIHHLPRREGV